MSGKKLSVPVVMLLVLGLCCSLSGCRCRRGPDEPGLKTSDAAVKQEPETKGKPRIKSGSTEIPDANLVTVHFDFDKYEIRNDAAATLKSNAAWIKDNLEKGEFEQIKVEGHCDERGTNKYNQVLGEKRADAVKNFLVDEGVPADILVSVSYGEESPVDTASNEEAWAKNRRGEFKKIIAAYE